MKGSQMRGEYLVRYDTRRDQRTKDIHVERAVNIICVNVVNRTDGYKKRSVECSG